MVSDSTGAAMDVGGVTIADGVVVVVTMSVSVDTVGVGGVSVSGRVFRLVNSFILVLATQTSTLGSKLH